ncbi:MAG: hypothetical protein IJ806_01875 [Ruminococcus sp.]|nr:hypothetical protein [Ruminococcus sp.]
MKIYGNEDMLARTAEMVRKHREPHSVIICGEKGLGKKAAAKYLAAQLMCEEKSGVPCGRCRACRMIENGAHPDLIMPVPNDKGNYIVKEIRDTVMEDIAVAPNEGDIKVFIISDLDMSTITSVQIQNILLKLIEEPPDHAALILTARNKESFLQTIISRCISFNMVNVTSQKAADYLQENFPEKSYEEISRAASAGGGNIGRCREFITGGDFRQAAMMAGSLADAYSAGSEYEFLKALSGAEGKKKLLRDGVYYFSEIVRDAALIISGGAPTLVSCDQAAAGRLAERLSPAGAVRLYDTLCETVKKIDANCSLTLTVNSLCASI